MLSLSSDAEAQDVRYLLDRLSPWQYVAPVKKSQVRRGKCGKCRTCTYLLDRLSPWQYVAPVKKSQA